MSLDRVDLFSDFKSLIQVKPPDMPPICDFAESPHFLNKKLYPRQKTLLKLIFLETENMTAYDIDVISEWAEQFSRAGETYGVQPDIWERVKYLKDHDYDHFRVVAFIGGRRASKGVLGAICGARQNWRLLQMGDPQYYYGVEPGKDLYMYVTATTIDQAKQFQFADFATTIIEAPCFRPYISTFKEYYISFRTEKDRKRVETLRSLGVKVDREIATIRNEAKSSNSRSGRGAAAFMDIFDEFAHMLTGTEGPNTAEEVWKAYTPSLDQLGKDALIYIPSSPYTKIGKAFEVYNDGLTVDEITKAPSYPNYLVIQLPSWAPYEDWDDLEITGGRIFRGAPQLYDDEARREERRDPRTFKVEKKAQWAEVIDAYLDPEMVDDMFEDFDDPTTGQKRHLSETPYGVLTWMYRGHADPSKSGANFAAAIGHTEPFPYEETDENGKKFTTEAHHVIFDWMYVWKPEDFDDHQIDYELIENELADRISKFQTMSVFSYDQYGAFVTVPQMKRRLKSLGSTTRVREDTFTGPANQKRAERFKSALGMRWVHCYKDDFGPNGVSLLDLELKFLQEINGKVQAQTIGPVTTKDLADCIMVVTSELLSDQLSRLKKRESLGKTEIKSGAQGGYHTGGMGAEEASAARAKLNAVGRSSSLSKAGYGTRRR